MAHHPLDQRAVVGCRHLFKHRGHLGNGVAGLYETNGSLEGGRGTSNDVSSAPGYGYGRVGLHAKGVRLDCDPAVYVDTHVAEEGEVGQGGEGGEGKSGDRCAGMEQEKRCSHALVWNSVKNRK